MQRYQRRTGSLVQRSPTARDVSVISKSRRGGGLGPLGVLSHKKRLRWNLDLLGMKFVPLGSVRARYTNKIRKLTHCLIIQAIDRNIFRSEKYLGSYYRDAW
jgi:hypothetical protein